MRVTPDELTGTEQAVLLVLMAECRPVRNPELKELGPELKLEHRKRLNEKGLVESTRDGTAYVHELTDDGWRMCRAIIGADTPPRSQGQGKALYTLMRALDRYFVRADLPVSEVFLPDAADLEKRVRETYTRLANRPGGWVPLLRLRTELGGPDKQELDAVLRRMYRAPGVHLIPEENQKVLTVEDRAAAIEIGDQDKHLIAIEL
ncbi:MAG: hypothetical protein JST91_22450 [Actinobacteria bacterium]|nr:hypothetical protein [Actinomycetota bacterium]